MRACRRTDDCKKGQQDDNNDERTDRQTDGRTEAVGKEEEALAGRRRRLLEVPSVAAGVCWCVGMMMRDAREERRKVVNVLL